MSAGLRAGLAGGGRPDRSGRRRGGRSTGPTRGSRLARRGGRASWCWADLARRRGGQQRDAVALEVAAVGSAGNAEPQERHGADVAAGLAFDAGFLAGALAGRPAAVKPGGEHVIRQAVAADEGSADVPAEHRRAVVAAARVAAGQVAAVLPEPAPQRGLAGRCQRVGADAHHPAAAVRAVLAVLEEEVQALRRAAGTAGALTQATRPAQPGGQLIQDPVELTGICPAAAARGRQMTRPGWTGCGPSSGGAGRGWLPGPGAGPPSGRR